MKREPKVKPVRHPMQPLVHERGALRFKRNAIVAYIVDWCAAKNGCVGYGHIDTSGPAPSLNELAMMDFPAEDRMQLAQLIGYSVHGYAELNYVQEDNARKLARIISRPAPKRRKARKVKP